MKLPLRDQQQKSEKADACNPQIRVHSRARSTEHSLFSVKLHEIKLHFLQYVGTRKEILQIIELLCIRNVHQLSCGSFLDLQDPQMDMHPPTSHTVSLHRTKHLNSIRLTRKLQDKLIIIVITRPYSTLQKMQRREFLAGKHFLC